MIDFNGNPDIGQMHPTERKLIYDIVRQTQPTICVECGTWKGAGSTYFISNALCENNKGILHTWETDVELFNFAVNFYNDKPNLKAVIRFNNSDFLAGIKQLTSIDFALLDGPDWPDYTLEQVKYLETIMHKNDHVIIHDWNVEKCSKVKPYLYSGQKQWEAVCEINNTSTGMICFKKL